MNMFAVVVNVHESMLWRYPWRMRTYYDGAHVRTRLSTPIATRYSEPPRRIDQYLGMRMNIQQKDMQLVEAISQVHVYE